jgi:hypothetical protein
VQQPEIIDHYDVMFAVRTGVTIMIPKIAAFDDDVAAKAEFEPSATRPGDVLITAAGKSAVLRDLRKDYLEEAVERGVIMFYELKNDEVVRCTPCTMKADGK